MPFPFVLSTTSHLTFQSHFTSSTHPSLPSATTSQRNVLRSALKSHKRLNPQDQSSNLTTLVSCLSEYLKYLTSIDYALSGKPVSEEDVEIALTQDVEVEWRPTLSSSTVPGREPDRVKDRGLDYEIHFVYHTLAVLQILLARQSLLGLYATTIPTAEQRTSLIQNALKYLRTAHSVHTYLTQRAHAPDGGASFSPQAIDISPTVQSALQKLTNAEINLLCVLKDDPYPSLLIQTRNQDDKEWMIKAPTIPKVRAQVLTRLCIGASEHASAALASLKSVENSNSNSNKKVTKDLLEYVDDVRKTARARACRFQALDNDLAGKTGTAIAWLNAGLNELGMEVTESDKKDQSSSRLTSLSKLKSTWKERKEDKKIGSKSPKWGSDGGKTEEGRILEYLERKFTKTNNTINIQIVPEWRPLLNLLPSGMNMPIEEKWTPTVLEEDELVIMRGPPEESAGADGDSSDDDGLIGGDDENIGKTDGTNPQARGPSGAFPGTHDDYTRTGESYY